MKNWFIKHRLGLFSIVAILMSPALAIAEPTAKTATSDGMFSLLIIYVIAIALALVEIFLVPGFGMFGVGAVLALGFCGFQAFTVYGFTTGALVTLVLFVLAVIIVVVSIKIMLRTEAGKDMILNKSVTSTATDNHEKFDPDLWVGRNMKAVSDLRPAGKASFENETYEVYAGGKFLHSGDNLKVFKIKDEKLYVELSEEPKGSDTAKES